MTYITYANLRQVSFRIVSKFKILTHRLSLSKSLMFTSVSNVKLLAKYYRQLKGKIIFVTEFRLNVFREDFL